MRSRACRRCSGTAACVTPAIGGGRWLAERQVLVPWGDRDARGRDGLAAQRAAVAGEPARSAAGDGVRRAGAGRGDGARRASASTSTSGGTCRPCPAVLTESGRRRAIEAWAGPWPVVERGWDAARSRRAHRFQVVDADGSAWLLVCEGDALDGGGEL